MARMGPARPRLRDAFGRAALRWMVAGRRRRAHRAKTWPMRMFPPLPPRQGDAVPAGDAAVPIEEARTMDAGELLAHLAKRSRLIGACVTAALLLAVLYIFLTPAEY